MTEKKLPKAPASKKSSNDGVDAMKRKAGLRAQIAEALGALKYGQITILIRDGKVVQIDRTEKRRYSDLEGQYGDGI